MLLMNINLTPDQQQWLEAQVAAGRFSSVEQAVRVAVADLKSIKTDDLAWAKPYVDRARESAVRGDVISGEAFLQRLDASLRALRSS